MKVYIAGPYSAPTEEARLANTMRAIEAHIELVQKGHQPFCPHLCFFTEEHARDLGIEFTYEEWFKCSVVYLRHCDALLHLAHSPGADRELGMAMAIGLPVYLTTEAVPDAN